MQKKKKKKKKKQSGEESDKYRDEVDFNEGEANGRG
jgi:hypothetical protein